MIVDYVWANLTETPTVTCTKLPETVMSLRVNADADVYAETPQAIDKPPWIDSVANGAKRYASQQDSAPFHKALKTRDWMDDRGFSSSCHTKLMAALRGVIEKEVNEHPHNARSSPLMGAIARAMEDITTDQSLQLVADSN
ncbi:hypothetical protein ACTXT7_006355 [Hymenolepis weldensis]